MCLKILPAQTFFILPGIIEIRNSEIYSPHWSTSKFSSNDRHHHKFQNTPHIEDIPQKPHNRSDCKAKPIIKQPFQDHPSPVTPSWDHLIAPFQDHKQPIAHFQDHKMQIIPCSQYHLTTVDVRDIITLKHTFPTSLDTTGNMPGEYTIHVDLLIPPVQHAHRKVPIDVREEIEKAPLNGRQRNYNTSN